MTTTRLRNQQIVEMRAQGATRQEIARQFRITPGRVAMIERRAATDKAQAERRALLRAEIRAADDLDRRWPVENLVEALHLLMVARARLLTHLEQQHTKEMSLREFMDLVISEHAVAGHPGNRKNRLPIRGGGIDGHGPWPTLQRGMAEPAGGSFDGSGGSRRGRRIRGVVKASHSLGRGGAGGGEGGLESAAAVASTPGGLHDDSLDNDLCHTIVTHMKSTTIRELKHHTSKILSWVADGETVEVRRRNEPVAILSAPPRPSAVERPDFAARLVALYGAAVLPTTGSELISEARGDF